MEEPFLITTSRGRTKGLKCGSEGKKRIREKWVSSGSDLPLLPLTSAELPRLCPPLTQNILVSIPGWALTKRKEKKPHRRGGGEEPNVSGTVCPVEVTLSDFTAQTRLVSHVYSCIFKYVRGYITQMVTGLFSLHLKRVVWVFFLKLDHNLMVNRKQSCEN